MSPSAIAARAVFADASTRTGGVVDVDARGGLVKWHRLACARRAAARFPIAYVVDDDVRGREQDFLLVGELLAVGLHRRAEHHQRDLLHRGHGAALGVERRIAAGVHRTAAP